METIDTADKILHTMLEKLGFEFQTEKLETNEGPCLNILSDDGKHLIGRHGDRLDDIQYLMNRILQKHDASAPRIKVDCDGYRMQQEEELLNTARSIAEQVLSDGKPRKLKPLNGYHRRLAYNALQEIEGIQATSPSGNSRFKRIEIKKS